MESIWSVSKLSTESVGSRRELVANCVHTADADAVSSRRRCVLGITDSSVSCQSLLTCRKLDNTAAGGYLRVCTRLEPQRAMPMKNIAPRNIGARLGIVFALENKQQTD